MESLTDDMYKIMVKRAYDVCACTPKNVSVHLNGNKLDIKAFDKYVDLYLGVDKTENPRVHDYNEGGKLLRHHHMMVDFIKHHLLMVYIQSEEEHM